VGESHALMVDLPALTVEPHAPMGDFRALTGDPHALTVDLPAFKVDLPALKVDLPVIKVDLPAIDVGHHAIAAESPEQISKTSPARVKGDVPVSEAPHRNAQSRADRMAGNHSPPTLNATAFECLACQTSVNHD